MSSLFPEFKVDAATQSGNRHSKKSNSARLQVFPVFSSVRTSPSAPSGPLVVECCFIVAVESNPRLFPVLLFSFLSTFQPPSCTVHKRPSPYRPNPVTVCFSARTIMSLTAVNYSCAYELSSPLFLGFGAGALPAAALLFLPSLLQLSLHSLSRHGQVNTDRHQQRNP